MFLVVTWNSIRMKNFKLILVYLWQEISFFSIKIYSTLSPFPSFCSVFSCIIWELLKGLSHYMFKLIVSFSWLHWLHQTWSCFWEICVIMVSRSSLYNDIWFSLLHMINAQYINWTFNLEQNFKLELKLLKYTNRHSNLPDSYQVNTRQWHGKACVLQKKARECFFFWRSQQ